MKRIMDGAGRTASMTVASGLLMALGCGGDDATTGSGDTAADSGGTASDGADTTGAANLPEGCDFYVEPSADDQTAVQEALIDVQAGQTVCLGPGTFSFTRQLSLDADGATLQGDGPESTLLDFSPQVSGANGLLVSGNDVTLQQFGVLNTPGDGIRADAVDNIAFIGVDVIWETAGSLDNGAYGLYPVQSNGVTVQDCVVQGARDAGIYVGQSTNILVEDSEARGNVAGIEIENSTDAIVRNNDAYDNTAGILVFNLPGLDIGDGKRANVYNNRIENNNIDNFAEPGTVVAQVPPGVGVLILASDDNEVWDNDIRGNNSTAVLVIAYIDDLFAPPQDPEFDIYAEGNWFHDNDLQDNGTDPADLILLATESTVPAPDIIFGGCFDEAKDNSDGRLTNCVSGGDDEAPFMSVNLCGQGMVETVSDNHACEQTPLPTDL